MNYKELLRTLGGESKVYCTTVDDTLAVYNPHMILLRPAILGMPEALDGACVKTAAHDEKIRGLKELTRDRAVFTGITFLVGTTTVAAYLATAKSGEVYPVFLNKRYVDLMGSAPAATFATGNSYSPLYVMGKDDWIAYIYPMRIAKGDLDRLSSVLTLPTSKERGFTAHSSVNTICGK